MPEGPDGWETAQRKTMNLRRLFAPVLGVLRPGWPDILASAHTAFIPKTVVAVWVQDRARLRPISGACLAYRAQAWTFANDETCGA